MIWQSGDMVHISGYGTVTVAARTIWPGNSIIDLLSSTRLKVSISSDSADDAAGGTGATDIVVEYLDRSFKRQHEYLELAGTTPLYLEVSALQHAEISNAGSGRTNAGTIYIGRGVVAGGVPATVHDQIEPGEGTTQTLKYTVPAGKTFEIQKIETNADITVTDYTVQLCKTTAGTTQVLHQFQETSPGFIFEGGEIMTLRHKNATGAGTVYAHVTGKLI